MQDNTYTFRGIVLAAAACAALAACGGGGDLENGVTALTVSPNAMTISSTSSTACVPGDGGTYFIYGGNSPYTIQNSLPAFMTPSTTQVNEVGGSFSVKLLGGCMSPGIINVTDAMGRLTTVSITYQPQQLAASPAPQ